MTKSSTTSQPTAMRPDGQQISEPKMQAAAEHQQNHADLGELLRQFEVGDEAGRAGADNDAGDQLADEGWQLQVHGDEAHDQASPSR